MAGEQQRDLFDELGDQLRVGGRSELANQLVRGKAGRELFECTDNPVKLDIRICRIAGVSAGYYR